MLNRLRGRKQFLDGLLTTPVLQHPKLTAMMATLAYCVFILPINEAIAFIPPDSKKLLVISLLLKAGFGILLYSSINIFIAFVRQLALGNRAYWSWLKWSSLYLCIMFIIFLFIYPGHWVWDEFNILNAVQSYIPYAWQNYFTNIFYTFSLYIFPTGVTIVVVQILFASTVVGYVISRFEHFLNVRLGGVILLLVFLLPPIVLNNFYPLRMTMYSYIELLFLARIILLYVDGFRSRHKYRELFGLVLLATLLSFWRSEGIYYLAAIPALILMLRIFNRRNIRMFTPYVCIAAALLVVVAGGLITIETTDPEYSLTTFVSPLTVALQQPLHGKNLQANLTTIDSVLNLNVMREYPSYTEIPAFWNGGVRPDYTSHLTAFHKAYIQLVLDNPASFLRAKVLTFLAANGLENSTPTPVGLLIQGAYTDKTEAFVASRFYATNHFSHPLNIAFKRIVTRHLLMVNGADHVNKLGVFVWSAIPVIAGLLIILILSVLKKWWLWSIISALLLIRSLLIFVTAPAGYFMYYLSVYMVGYFLIVLTILITIGKKWHYLQGNRLGTKEY